MSVDEQTFLHLLGKAGTGKSSTGNTIVGERVRVFKSKASVSAVTKTIQEERCREMQNFVVVDGPGLVDMDTGINEVAIGLFRQVVEMNQESNHVFLIVCRYGERFTEEDEEMVKRIKGVFGLRALEKHSIVILTCGDNFERDTEDEGLSFKTWCEMQTGAFSDLRKWCHNRVLLVDNFKKPEHQEKSFLCILEEEIARITSGDISGKSLLNGCSIEKASSDSWWNYLNPWTIISFGWRFFSETDETP